MILGVQVCPSGVAQRIVAVFGVGLVGSAIVSALWRGQPQHLATLPLSWSHATQRAGDLAAIRTAILNLAAGPARQLDVVWAAGRAGFGSAPADLAPETQALADVLNWCGALTLEPSLASAQRSFHLVSSAGGLFEGQRLVDAATVPKPQRPYGEAKLAQEQMLAGIADSFRTCVYRPSSVYGVQPEGGRLGLLNTLIENAVTQRTTRIFGGLDTLRDYVLASDIGAFIADRIRAPDASSHIFLLANGKPTSIGHILRLVRKVIGRPLRVKLEFRSSNASDITFRPSGLPQGWRPTDLETGVCLVAHQLNLRFEKAS
jgi:nucleoside-diphosphate-sugar epimerase